MSLKWKSLQRDEMAGVLQKQCTIEHRKDDWFQGVICLLTFDEVSTKQIVENDNGKVCILDQGMHWLELLPENKNWCLTAMFDKDDQLFQTYIDITKTNNPQEQTFQDMKLDLIIAPGKEPLLIDQDELLQALHNNEITEEEYQLAHQTAESIIHTCRQNDKAIHHYLQETYQRLKFKQQLHFHKAEETDIPDSTNVSDRDCRNLPGSGKENRNSIRTPSSEAICGQRESAGNPLL